MIGLTRFSNMETFAISVSRITDTRASLRDGWTRVELDDGFAYGAPMPLEAFCALMQSEREAEAKEALGRLRGAVLFLPVEEAA